MQDYWSLSSLQTYVFTTPFQEDAFSIDLEKTLKVYQLLLLLLALYTFHTRISGIDSTLSDNFGRSIMFGISTSVTIITVSAVGGIPFIVAAILLGTVYYNSRCSR